MAGSLIHAAVLRTRNLPGLSGLYRAVYRAALDSSARALGAVSGVEGVALHRGLTGPGWTPGVSDIDLIVRIAEREDEKPILDGLARSYRGLKRTYPMLGDLWIGTARELDAYRVFGGLRAVEDAPSWTPLRGGAAPGSAEPGAAGSADKKRWLDPWVWAFTSYAELCRRRFKSASAVPGKDAADARKIYADLRRFCAFIEGGDTGLAPASDNPGGAGTGGVRRLAGREETLRRLGGEGALPMKELWLDAALRLGRASRLVLEKAAGESRFTPVFPASPDSGEHERLGYLLSTLKGAEGVVLDGPYHTYCLYGEDPAAGLLEAAGKRIAGSNLPFVPLVLDRASWSLVLQSSYLGAPLGRTVRNAAGESPCPLAAGWGGRAFGSAGEGLRALAPGLVMEAAAEAASWLLVWRRFLWIDPGSGNRFTLFHLYSRLVGLRLALAGRKPRGAGPHGGSGTPGLAGRGAGAFSDPARGARASAEAFPEDRALYESLERFFLEEPGECVEFLPRNCLAEEHAAVLALLARRLAEALERGEGL